jgi:hypothetical protein
MHIRPYIIESTNPFAFADSIFPGSLRRHCRICSPDWSGWIASLSLAMTGVNRPYQIEGKTQYLSRLEYSKDNNDAIAVSLVQTSLAAKKLAFFRRGGYDDNSNSFRSV